VKTRKQTCNSAFTLFLFPRFPSSFFDPLKKSFPDAIPPTFPLLFNPIPFFLKSDFGAF
jgi:hypothetical protein